MADRKLPLHVFHFDCFWMREFNWIDLEWDRRAFPDPAGMLQRLKERGLHICAWINPYPAHLHINTRADWRGSGIGTALMNAYLDQLRSEHVPGVHLETSSENKIAVPWYEKLGFQLLQSIPTDLYQPSVGHVIGLMVFAMRL